MSPSCARRFGSDLPVASMGLLAEDTRNEVIEVHAAP
jgi:hypothetical protein